MVFTRLIDKKQYRLLSTLYEGNKSEENLKAICRLLGEPSLANFSRLITTLEKEGLVFREHYGRERRVRLTEAGETIVTHLNKIVDLYEENQARLREERKNLLNRGEQRRV